MAEEKLIWKNLKDMTCPKCTGLLLRKPMMKLWVCSHGEPIFNKPCDFKITFERFDQIVNSLYNPKGYK